MARSPSHDRFAWSVALLAAALTGVGCLGLAASAAMLDSADRLLRQQLVWIGLAAAVAGAVAFCDYRWLRRSAYLGLAICLALLVAVFFFPAVNGAHRWLRVGTLSVQPSELTKIFFVAATARWLMRRDAHRRLRGLAAPLLMAAAPAALIVREPDLGTALIFFPVLLCILLAAGARMSHVLAICLAGALLAPAFWTLMSREQISRVTAVWTQTGPGETPDDDGYHLHQAKQVVALGGLWGMGAASVDEEPPPGYYVPAPATDSIFVVLAGRYGLVAAGGVLLMYLLLVERMLAVALRTEEPFARLLTVGVAALFAVQTIINTAMMVGLLPITGMSLPLMSYGGSGLLAHAFAIGLVLSVSRRPRFEFAGEPFRFAQPTPRAAAR